MKYLESSIGTPLDGTSLCIEKVRWIRTRWHTMKVTWWG